MEGPQEVVGSLEVRAACCDLVNQVLNADNVVLAQRLLDDAVISQRNTLLVHLAESTLVHELLDGLQVGVPGS